MIRGALLVLITVLATRSLHAQSCVIRGRTSAPISLHVAPRGSTEEDRFDVEVTDVPLAIHPGSGPVASVDVVGPFQFMGRTESRWLPLATTSSTSAADGMARITPATRISGVIGAGRGLVLNVIVGGTISVSGLWVPCRAVQLTVATSSDSSGGSAPDSRRFAILTRRRAVFRSRPGSGSQMVVHVYSTADVIFAVTGHLDGWTRLEWFAGDGARIMGWVRDALIRRVGNSGGIWHTSIHCGSGCGTRNHLRMPGEYVGPARLRDGATVFTDPEGIAWARAGALTIARVARVGSEPWVRVLRVDGLTEDAGCEFSHAWVRAEDVEIRR